MTSLRRFKTSVFSAATALILLFAVIVHAQSPTVYGVFFYSPTCPHCQDVINNHWPAIQSEFGDQLHVLFVNVTTEQGSQVMRDAITALGIQSNGVPMLIIGTDVLVGSVEIPARAPEVIRAGLDAGGLGLPAIPGIEALYNAALEQSAQTPTEAQTTTPSEPEPTVSWNDRLAADPVANALAVVILALLVLSLVIAPGIMLRKPAPGEEMQARRYQHAAVLLASLIGVGMSLALAAGANGNPTILLLAAAEAVVFLIVLGATLRPPHDRRFAHVLTPLAAIGGAIVAAYLAYVELTLTEAVCGVVGNCNTVQQSSYARIFNIPIGVIGIVGYCLILVAWLLSRGSRVKVLANRLEYTMVLFGVAFSVYLTFLEPFVIGATCLWCLTSAVIMLLLLWLMTPPITESPPGNTTPA